MSTKQFSVLVVDDESPLRRVLLTSLRNSGFAVEEARTAEEALEVMKEQIFDLALLEINLAGMNGLELCREIRALGQPIGIVMVTVRDAEKDMVQALEAGADDCVTKPFRLGELMARCHAVLRRVHAGNAAGEASISAGDLELDLDRRLLRKAGKVVRLTPTEFNLLAFLMKNQGVPLTHAKLLRTIWGPEYGKELEYLRSYVRLLRKKIENDPAQPKYLVTEPWLGYRFCSPSSPESLPSNAGQP
ncbi:MAG: response regulator transcription factor [Acidobacteriia bacterium]|nr:response regulator transcription factor [Terriglobia bacterium]MBZ5720704.1 response regulator transcription factor [Terriglobia bacterium]